MMNKKEKAEMEELKTKLALKYYPKIEPDLEPPSCEEGDKVVNGYIYNAYLKKISKACTSSMYHSNYQWDKTTSHKPIGLYSTEELAYKAMLGDMSELYAKEMRAIELEIERLKK